MSHSHYELHYHIIWATKERRAMVHPELRDLIYSEIRRKGKELGCDVHAIGGTETHVHLAVSIPAIRSVAEVAQGVKGSSSHLLNTKELDHRLKWQEGYSALTIRKKDLPIVCRYIQEQEQRHAERRTWPEAEKLGNDTNTRDDSAMGMQG